MSNEKTQAEKLKSTFEDFKEVNEQRKKEIEEHGEALGETKETLNKLQEKMDELETKMERPNLGSGDTVDSEEKELFLKTMREPDSVDPDEKKALSVEDDSSGGYLAPSEYVEEIIEGVVEYSPIREVANVMPTSNKSVEVPVKTSSGAASWVGETESRTEDSTPSYGMEEIPNHELEALYKASRQSLQDSAFDLEGELRDEFSEQFGKAEGKAFVTGDAVGKPEGILTNPDVGSIDSDSNGSLSNVDAINLFYELKSSYVENAYWLMNRSTIKAVRKLTDSNGDYLWQPGYQETPNTIMGKPYLECPDMPDVSGGNQPIAIGDFSKGYMIVDRTDIRVLRDPYSSKPFVEFEGYKRVGGQVVLSEAIKKLNVTSA